MLVLTPGDDRRQQPRKRLGNTATEKIIVASENSSGNSRLEIKIPSKWRGKS